MPKKKKRIRRMSVLKLTKEQLDELDLIYDTDKPGWWIDDPNNPPCRYVGPYDTKAEATEAKRGLEQFWRNNNVE